MVDFFIRSIYFFFFITLLACKQQSASVNSYEGLDAFNRDSLVRHLIVLSSDSFQGRKPFTPGEARTVAYLTTNFKRLGLEPGNAESYLQDVPLVEITPNSDPTLTAESNKGALHLNRSGDYVLSTENADSIISLNRDELIFAGFGIVAPEYNWNDYDGVDVKGKIVLVLVNDPGFYDSSLFKGHTMTYYGRWTYKYEEAARQGAKACLIVHNIAAASYPFNVVQNSWGGSNLYLDRKENKKYHCALQGWITGSACNKLLILAGKDSSIYRQAYRYGFRAIPMNLKLTTNVHVKAKYNKSYNVMGKITGTKWPDQYIIYTAHWDHLGVGRPDEKGDSIYNGALDNGSGCAALLELARAFKILKNKPQRSILFLSVTAEEQGLLGSAYYSQHPVYPLNKTVAEINMDVVNAHGKTRDVVITGAGQSELEDFLVLEAKKQGRYMAPETHPEAGYYFRSDHFNFAKAGIPALDAASGIDFVGKGKEYGKKIQEDYTANHYHRPSDEFDRTWTFEGGLQDMELLFQIGKRLAHEESWPKWKQGSEFKAIRDTSMRESQ